MNQFSICNFVRIKRNALSPVTGKLSHLFQKLWPMRHLLHNRGWIGGKHLSSCQMHLFYLSYFNAYSYSYWVFITQHNQSQDIKNYLWYIHNGSVPQLLILFTNVMIPYSVLLHEGYCNYLSYQATVAVCFNRYHAAMTEYRNLKMHIKSFMLSII